MSWEGILGSVTKVTDTVQKGATVVSNVSNTYNSTRASLNSLQNSFNDATGINGNSGGGGVPDAPIVVPTAPAATYVPPTSTVPQAYTPPVFYNQNPAPATPAPAAGMSTNMIIGLVAGGFFFLVLMVVVVIIATKK